MSKNKINPELLAVERRVECCQSSEIWLIQVGVPRKVRKEWHVSLKVVSGESVTHKTNAIALNSYDAMRYALNVVDAHVYRLSKKCEGSFEVDGFIYPEPEEAKNPPPD